MVCKDIVPLNMLNMDHYCIIEEVVPTKSMWTEYISCKKGNQNNA